MGNTEFMEKCKMEVCKYHNDNANEDDYISMEDVFIVWMVKVLQNNKALAATNKEDNRYYEITYNGDKKEMYVDAYKKEENKLVKIEE